MYDKNVIAAFHKFRVDTVISASVFLEEGVVSANRNNDYYDYKSFTNNFTIKIDDTVFWIKIKNGLLIGDVEIKSIEKFETALNTLKTLASRNGITEIIFQASPNTLLAKIMETRCNEKFDSWVVGFKNFTSDFPLEKLKFTFGDLDTF